MVIEIGQVVQDFAIIMILASVMALISYKLKQSLIIGYIIAGILLVAIGILTINLIHSPHGLMGV
jgi:Kef-type K+ transport system membrane component KefB